MLDVLTNKTNLEKLKFWTKSSKSQMDGFHFWTKKESN